MLYTSFFYKVKDVLYADIPTKQGMRRKRIGYGPHHGATIEFRLSRFGKYEHLSCVTPQSRCDQHFYFCTLSGNVDAGGKRRLAVVPTVGTHRDPICHLYAPDVLHVLQQLGAKALLKKWTAYLAVTFPSNESTNTTLAIYSSVKTNTPCNPVSFPNLLRFLPKVAIPSLSAQTSPM